MPTPGVIEPAIARPWVSLGSGYREDARPDRSFATALHVLRLPPEHPCRVAAGEPQLPRGVRILAERECDFEFPGSLRARGNRGEQPDPGAELHLRIDAEWCVPRPEASGVREERQTDV